MDRVTKAPLIPPPAGAGWPTLAAAAATVGFCAALTLAAGTSLSATIQEGDAQMRSVWDGVYSEEQAGRGKRLFEKNCADCHQPAEFKEGYQTANDLFLSKELMPQTAPGSLEAQEYADIIAHIFEDAGFPAGKEEMKGEEEVLKRIKIEAKKPAGK